MKEQNSGMMENDIIAEDISQNQEAPKIASFGNLPKLLSNSKQVIEKGNKIISYLKRPKTIIIIICLLALIAVSFSLLIISLRPKAQIVPNPNFVITTPQTQYKTKNIDPELQKDLDSFSKKVEDLNSKQIDFSPPVIDFKSMSSF